MVLKRSRKRSPEQDGGGRLALKTATRVESARRSGLPSPGWVSALSSPSEVVCRMAKAKQFGRSTAVPSLPPLTALPAQLVQVTGKDPELNSLRHGSGEPWRAWAPWKMTWNEDQERVAGWVR